MQAPAFPLTVHVRMYSSRKTRNRFLMLLRSAARRRTWSCRATCGRDPCSSSAPGSDTGSHSPSSTMCYTQCRQREARKMHARQRKGAQTSMLTQTHCWWFLLEFSVFSSHSIRKQFRNRVLDVLQQTLCSEMSASSLGRRIGTLS